MISYIALGSNIGNRQEHCEQAIALLAQNPKISVTQVSKWYNTKAVCLPGEVQPDFINGVVCLNTDLPPENLYKLCKEVESHLGREMSEKRWQPRVIDLDILFHGRLITEEKNLKIPHPLLHERLFVLEPLNEIAPDFVHPILKITVAKIYKDVLKKSHACS